MQTAVAMHCSISGRKLAADIRAGTTTSVEALEYYIGRIEALDGKTNLVVVKMYDAARQRAAEADAALARGELWGRLHGVPMTVKENFVPGPFDKSIGVRGVLSRDSRCAQLQCAYFFRMSDLYA